MVPWLASQSGNHLQSQALHHLLHQAVCQVVQRLLSQAVNNHQHRLPSKLVVAQGQAQALVMRGTRLALAVDLEVAAWRATNQDLVALIRMNWLAVQAVNPLLQNLHLARAPGLTVAVYMVTLCSSGIAILQQHVRVVSVAMQSGNATTIQAV